MIAEMITVQVEWTLRYEEAVYLRAGTAERGNSPLAAPVDMLAGRECTAIPEQHAVR